MKHLCRLFYLKDVTVSFSKKLYFNSLRKCEETSHHKTTFCSFSHSNQETTASSLPNFENGKILSKEFPEPKKLLWRIVNEAYAQNESSNINPKLDAKQIIDENNGQNLWQVTLEMVWPKPFSVTGTAVKKSEAITLTFLRACQKMKDYGVLDTKNRPVLAGKPDTKNTNSSKSIILNLYKLIWIQHGKKEYLPKFSTQKIGGVFGNEIYWKSQLSVLYPEARTFEGCSVRSREAESIAAAKALSWLTDKGIINHRKRLVRYSQQDETKLLNVHASPYSVCIPKDLQARMECVMEKIKSLDLKPGNEENETSIETTSQEVYDIITNKLFQTPSEEEIHRRSKKMHENRQRAFSTQYGQNSRSSLPIHDNRLDILKMLDENQVVILSGETGCGKTTQVPQFILDSFIEKMQGAKCNIVVTQPRRISAISIAERVAFERSESVGETIGHHVRLNKKLPQQKGAILYCSTGMLLRKLCSNPNLKGISHVIVDEVHERNIQIDFLLILLKRLLEHNRDVKVLLMSASFNTSVFSQYFRDSPVLHVPGKVYPVQEYFLEDFQKDIVENPNDITKITKTANPVLNHDLIFGLIHRIHTTQPSGAILCFLPGWHDILTIQTKLQDSGSQLMICCAHSRLSYAEQKKIFSKPPLGLRKVILATNIAETSITVDDVVYVVNSGLHKGTSFDSEKGVRSLGTQWITKANVRQRRGRAGRVQPGVCYHLFTRKKLMEMDDYPIPELLRIPLERVILDCKLYCPDSKAEEFLSMALQPPSPSALHTGVSELQISGILDENENLTNLGKIVVTFPTHPRLSVALVYGAFLKCLDPVLTICAILTLDKELFVNTLEEKSIIKKIKQNFDNFIFSDHLALSKIFDTWINISEESEKEKFVAENLLDPITLNFIKDLKGLFADELHSNGLIANKDSFTDPLDPCNANRSHVPSILAALTAAFYPNIIKLLQGEIAHGRLNKDTVIYSLLKGQRGYIQKESVVSHEHELPSPWLIYFSALQSEARRLMMTSSVSAVPGICLLLFGGQTLAKENSPKASFESVIIMDDHKKINFSCSHQEADVLLHLRKYLEQFFSAYVHSLQTQPRDTSVAMTTFYEEFLPVLKEVLALPQVPFTKGQSYKFVDNTLVSEDL